MSTTTLKTGTRVVVETTNGGRICGTLTSEYVPTFPVLFTHDECGHAVSIPGYRVRDVRRRCCIQWVDGNGNPTPDVCTAIGEVYRRAYTSHLHGQTIRFEQTEHFPICAWHLRRLDDAGMEHWIFEAYMDAPEPGTHAGSYDSVFNALCTRIRNVRSDLVATYGTPAVMAAAETIASQFESVELDEIGTSDVSCWIADMEASLKGSRP